MNVRHSVGVLHSFSIKNIFYDEMVLSAFYFRAIIYLFKATIKTVEKGAKYVQS